MALQINYTNEQGIDITYWRINSIFINFSDRICNIYVRGYKDQQAREDGKDFIIEKIFNLPDDGISFPEELNDSETDNYQLRPLFYTKLKEFEFFSNAVDC